MAWYPVMTTMMRESETSTLPASLEDNMLLTPRQIPSATARGPFGQAVTAKRDANPDTASLLAAQKSQSKSPTTQMHVWF